MAYKNKSTAKVTWRELNKGDVYKTKEDQGAEKTANKCHGPSLSPYDLIKNIGFIDHKCRREPFAGGPMQYAPEEVRKDPKKLALWKKYVNEQKSLWNDEMRQEARQI
tara:strand:+ start:630 stop:953 length:324 start_codon:yes stop_codon:yes gene_type:complete